MLLTFSPFLNKAHTHLQLMPRSGQDLATLNEWSDRMRSYCNDNDPACAGRGDQEAYLWYFENDMADAALWVKDKLGIQSRKEDIEDGEQPVLEELS